MIAGIEEQHEKDPIIEAATGLGKTLMNGLVCDHYAHEGPILGVVHRTHLIDSWKKFFEERGYVVLIEQGDRYHARPIELIHAQAGPHPVVLLAAVITLGHRRLHKWVQEEHGFEFAFGFIDEVHRAGSAGYRYIRKHMNVRRWGGWTATPYVAGMANEWRVLETRYDLLWGIENGYLTNIGHEMRGFPGWEAKELRPPAMPGFPKNKQISETERAAIQAERARIAAIQDLWFDGQAGRRRLLALSADIREAIHKDPHSPGLVYMPSVLSATTLSEVLCTRMSERDQERQIALWTEHDGLTRREAEEKIAYIAEPIRSAYYVGDTTDARRKEILASIRSTGPDTLQLIVSVDAMIDGLNVNNANKLFIIRWTELDHLYMQILGRIVRPPDSVRFGLNEVESADERRTLLEPHKATVYQYVPLRVDLKRRGSTKLLSVLRPDLEDRNLGDDDDGLSLLERAAMAEMLQDERAQRERDAVEREQRRLRIEHRARVHRSPWLVDRLGHVRVEEVDYLRDGPVLTEDKFYLTWKEYKEAGYLAVAQASQYTEKKRELAASLFTRCKVAKREDFMAYTGLPDIFGGRSTAHWLRWTKKRMGAEPQYRAPKAWARFDERRNEMADHFHTFLRDHAKVGPERALRAARLLYFLSHAFTQDGVTDECDYWHEKVDPRYVGHKKAYAQGRKTWRK